MSTAFVLSGGASLGAAQVGMLQALHEAGVKPDLVVGTSVGSLNAAFVAGAGDLGSLDALQGIWESIGFHDVFPVRPAGAIRGLLGRHNHLVEPTGLQRLIRNHIGFDRLESARLPIHVITTEALTGRHRVLSRGPTAPALLASCAIPGIFPPVRVGGVELLDGGVVANTAVSEAVALGATKVYVLPAGYACALRRPPETVIGMLLHSLSLVMEAQLIADVRSNEGRAEIHVLPPVCPNAVSPHDFGHAHELITRARASSRKWLRTAAPGRYAGAIPA